MAAIHTFKFYEMQITPCYAEDEDVTHWSVRAHNPITKLSKGKNPITGIGRMIIKDKITYTNTSTLELQGTN